MPKPVDPLKAIRDLAHAVPRLKEDLLDARARIARMEEYTFNAALDDRVDQLTARITTLESVNQALENALFAANGASAPKGRKRGPKPRG